MSLRAAGDNPVNVWVSSWGTALVEDCSWEEDEGQGLRVVPVAQEVLLEPVVLPVVPVVPVLIFSSCASTSQLPRATQMAVVLRSVPLALLQVAVQAVSGHSIW